MTLNEAVEQAEGYISKLNEVIKWFGDTTRYELEQTGEAVLEDYDEILTGWEVSDSWGVMDEESVQVADKYHAIYKGFVDKLKELEKEVEKACQPLTRWDILDMKADELYDEMRAEEARNK